jgi:hypothetical protein
MNDQIHSGEGINFKNRISVENSTTTPLSAGAAFTGSWEEVVSYTTAGIAVLGSAATDGTLYLDLSSDNGGTKKTITHIVSDVTNFEDKLVNLVQAYFRIRYVQGDRSMSGTFSIQTKFSNGQPMEFPSREGDVVGSIEDTTEAVELAASERKHDALTEKDILLAILNRLTAMEKILMVGVEPDYVEMDNLTNNTSDERDYNGY